MKLGICGGLDQIANVVAAGWEYVEGNTQSLFRGEVPDAEFAFDPKALSSPLPIPSCNALIPGGLRLTGPGVDMPQVKAYLANALKRAAKLNCRVLVFGSGGARNVPAGFDREAARKQLVQFLQVAGQIASENGVVIVIEPLRKPECNIINTIGEAMTYVREVNLPSIQCLLDTFHFWEENEPLENLRQAMPSIKHVHVADKEGRLAPGESGTSDYREVFKILKQGDYNGLISVEGRITEWEQSIRRSLAFLKKQWAEA